MSEKPVVLIRGGELAGQSWPIEGNRFLIGRGSECHMVLPERQVSRQHAEIVYSNGRYRLYDLDSKNGTHVNGQKVIAPIDLQDGDAIQIALCVSMVFIGSDATVPLTMEPPPTEQPLVLDEDQRTAIIRGQVLMPPLSLSQFRLLKALFDARGAVADRDTVVNAVWPGTEGMGVSEQAIDALVRRLRDRLAELDPYNYIVTVRGHGFRLDNEPH